ncbi:MAG: hypothetical protein EZS28_049288, partial [Streblomastix strix]
SDPALIKNFPSSSISITELSVFIVPSTLSEFDLIFIQFPIENKRSDNKKLFDEREIAGIDVEIWIAPPHPNEFQDPGSVLQFMNDESVIEMRLLRFNYTTEIAPPDPD